LKKKTDRRDANGFTLVEILVAMVIFSVTLLTLFSSFRAFLTSGSLVSDEITQTEQLRMGLKRIVLDLENIFIVEVPRHSKPSYNSDPDEYRFQASLSQVKGNPFSRLSFTSLNHAKIGLNPIDGVARIEYYVHDHGDRLDLRRSDRLPPYPDAGDPCSDPILFKDISEFTLTYENLAGEASDTWDSESKEVHFMFPDRVKIRVGLKASGRIIETAVTLPVNRQAIQ